MDETLIPMSANRKNIKWVNLKKPISIVIIIIYQYGCISYAQFSDRMLEFGSIFFRVIELSFLSTRK